MAQKGGKEMFMCIQLTENLSIILNSNGNIKLNLCIRPVYSLGKKEIVSSGEWFA